jgi:hypothetical protein
MMVFSELTERLGLPGVMAHLAVVLGLILTVLLVTWHTSAGTGDAVRMEVRSCSR